MEPLRVTAGETLSWTRTIAAYPASVWTGVYYFRNESNVIPPITCTADGLDHQVSVDVATSSTWKPGNYFWTLYVEKSAAGVVTERYEIDRGEIEVAAFAGSGTPADGRSFAQMMVDQLEALMLRVSKNDATNLSLGTGTSRSKTFKTLAEVETSLARWRAIVRSERDAAKTARGETTGRRKTVKFV